jgi:hypothetical protein
MIEKHVEAIALCLRTGLPNPALILLYVGIDAFGALGRPVGRHRSPRKDFESWVDRYMIKGLPVTSMELYGARCGILHTLGPDSTLSMDGRVRPIIYAWGNQEAESANIVLQEVAKRNPAITAVMLKVENLADTFVEGMSAFEKDVDADPLLKSAVAARAAKMFGYFDNFPGVAPISG